MIIISGNLQTAMSYAFSSQFVSRDSNTIHTVSAGYEIIVAAGAVHSPQILQLSGIGPRKLLSGLGIEVLVDLPGVGYNFHDQPSMFMSFNCQPDFLFTVSDHDTKTSNLTILQTATTTPPRQTGWTPTKPGLRSS
jgi:choline dehydrogenase-like flavoprotein